MVELGSDWGLHYSYLFDTWYLDDIKNSLFSLEDEHVKEIVQLLTKIEKDVDFKWGSLWIYDYLVKLIIKFVDNDKYNLIKNEDFALDVKNESIKTSEIYFNYWNNFSGMKINMNNGKPEFSFLDLDVIKLVKFTNQEYSNKNDNQTILKLKMITSYLVLWDFE